VSSRRNFVKLLSIAPIGAQLLKSSVLGLSAQTTPQVADRAAPIGPVDQMAGSPVGDPLPGQPWKVHDRSRPQARKVLPGLPVPENGRPRTPSFSSTEKTWRSGAREAGTEK
jgi:hypothetical protein